jgi:fatty acid desaturase
MYSKSNFVKKYFLGYAILQLVILLFWIWLPQSLNPALIPIVLIASWRSWNIYKR